MPASPTTLKSLEALVSPSNLSNNRLPPKRPPLMKSESMPILSGVKAPGRVGLYRRASSLPEPRGVRFLIGGKVFSPKDPVPPDQKAKSPLKKLAQKKRTNSLAKSSGDALAGISSLRPSSSDSTFSTRSKLNSSGSKTSRTSPQASIGKEVKSNQGRPLWSVG